MKKTYEGYIYVRPLERGMILSYDKPLSEAGNLNQTSLEEWFSSVAPEHFEGIVKIAVDIAPIEWDENQECEGMSMRSTTPMHSSGYHMGCSECGGLEPSPNNEHCFNSESHGHREKCTRKDVYAPLGRN